MDLQKMRQMEQRDGDERKMGWNDEVERWQGQDEVKQWDDLFPLLGAESASPQKRNFSPCDHSVPNLKKCGAPPVFQ